MKFFSEKKISKPLNETSWSILPTPMMMAVPPRRTASYAARMVTGRPMASNA
jgi:hypothetical protein